MTQLNQFEWGKFSIELTEDKKYIRVRNKADSTVTKPIAITEPLDNFAKKIGDGLSSEAFKLLPPEQLQSFTTQLIDWLTTSMKPPEELEKLVFGEEETKPVQIKVEQGVGLEKFMEEETKEVVIEKPKVEEKPVTTEIDSAKLVMRYQELTRAKIPHETIIQCLANENPNIPQQTIEKLLPALIPVGEQITPPSPPPTIAEPETKIIEQSVMDELKSLPTQQKQMLKKLAEIYHTDEKVIIAKCVEEAKQSPIPMHWLNRLLQYGIRHNLFSTKKERVIHAVFAHTDGFIDATVEPKQKVEIDKCYTIEGRPVRCIARSVGTRGREFFMDYPHINELREIAEIGTVHHSLDIMKSSLHKLSDVFSAVQTKEGMYAVVSGSIIDAREPKEGIWYITIHDGSPIPVGYNVFSIELVSENNPFGLTDDTLKNSVGKTAFCYGWMKLVPASESFSKDSVKILPEFLVIG